MLHIVTHSPAETEEFAQQIAERLRPGDVIAYRGGMGMGKTAFTRGLARGLGLQDDVCSPTFSLVNEYRGENGITLCHFDMYRVTSWEDLYSTGFFDYLDGENILAIEWSENVPEALDHPIVITIAPGQEESWREITVEGGDRF